jgi:hypothetical protein
LEKIGKIRENIRNIFKNFENFVFLNFFEILKFLFSRHHGAHEGMIFSCIIPWAPSQPPPLITSDSASPPISSYKSFGNFGKFWKNLDNFEIF